MSRTNLRQSLRPWLRIARNANTARPASLSSHAYKPVASSARASSFSTCAPRFKGIMPDTENPAKPSADTTSGGPAKPVELTEAEYHEVADHYLDRALAKFEEIQDQADELDVEFASGVMTIRVPEKGTYVLNKQPPNKQIWLSSPISGPKRYDWCIFGDGQNDKEGTATGHWVYARDGSTLDSLILEELGYDLQEPLHAWSFNMAFGRK
ncbi:uncharacterized protein J7T54_007028 [Emericellopsis cladophorae]|uniref:ferroxidase n=1 Tax=Emericellopsis cladophorae TaxID=2686198 RepID=A0A9P9Y8H5_9HYPO|nr:uncharacterized protein J7T54_007028 [Emericellopsis cladophorae]KAI6785386.1 hypothetical protein J7T54_007028 [Emericellopsis cladophorae]